MRGARVRVSRTMPPPNAERNMQLIRSATADPQTPTAVAIGNFDGMHRGHQAVFAAMRAEAQAGGLTPAALSFHPHPRRFFAPQSASFALESLGQKCRHFSQQGADIAWLLRFDVALARMGAERFLEEVLETRLRARAVITGANFVFGAGREGDTALLQQWGAARGVVIRPVSAVEIGGQVASSSAVRHAITRGDMATATALLGRPYAVMGRVRHGDQRGRTLGFPTANLRLNPALIAPRPGVYVARARWHGGEADAVVNWGSRPTVAGTMMQCEAHLLRWQGDLYGARLELSLRHRLRDEQAFADLKALTAQITQDVVQAQAWLADAGIAHDAPAR